jgi:hypothetical protein
LLKKDGEKQMSEHDFIYRWNNPNGMLDMPLPETITCPICGYEIALWTYEEETMCYICGFKAFKKETIIH